MTCRKHPVMKELATWDPPAMFSANQYVEDNE